MTVRSEWAELKANLDRLHRECLAVKAEVKFRALMRALRTFTPDDDHFNPEQPRDWHGRWTVIGGDASAEGDSAPSVNVGQVFSIFADVDSVPLNQRIAQRSNNHENSDTSAPQEAGAVVTYNSATTGDQRVDRTTNTLMDTLRRVVETVEFIPVTAPNVYGTAVHFEFANAIREQKLNNVEVEQSYKSGSDAYYGESGSVRTDVILRSDDDRVIAIYDLKTGDARLRSSRAGALRDHVGASPFTPVIELHVLRGSNLKHGTLSSYTW